MVCVLILIDDLKTDGAGRVSMAKLTGKDLFVTASQLVKPADSDYPRSCHCFHSSAGSLFDCIVSSVFVAHSAHTRIVAEEVENE